jgi:hypothetical protein
MANLPRSARPRRGRNRRTSANTGRHGGPGQVSLRWGLAGFLAATTAVSAAPTDTEMLDLPLDDLLRVEIRSAGKREQ